MQLYFSYFILISMVILNTFLHMSVMSNLFEKRRFQQLLVIIFSILNAFLVFFVAYKVITIKPIHYLLFAAIYSLELRLTVKSRFLVLFTVTTAPLLHIFVLRSIFIAIFALIFDISMYSLLETPNMVLYTLLTTFTVHNITWILFKIVIKPLHLKIIVENLDLFGFIAIVTIILTSYTVYNVTIFSVDTLSKIIISQQIVLPLLLLILFYFCLILMLRNVVLHHYKLKSQQVEIDLLKEIDRDSLTGLLNRRGIEKYISEHLEKLIDSTLFIIDIDNFKAINDTMGHTYGDKVLQEIATIIKEHFTEEDFVSRMGGDEFVVLMTNNINEEYIIQIASDLCRTLEKSYNKNDHVVKISTSIGICTTRKSVISLNELYEFADIALYKSKERGKNTYTIYK